MGETIRTASLHRQTGETDIELTLNLDGTGKTDIDTGIVIPLWRSKAIVSVLVVPLSTLPCCAIAPLTYKRLSVKVVFPAST